MFCTVYVVQFMSCILIKLLVGSLKRKCSLEVYAGCAVFVGRVCFQSPKLEFKHSF